MADVVDAQAPDAGVESRPGSDGDDAPVDDGSTAFGRGLDACARQVTWPRALLAVVVATYTTYYTVRSLDIHHALGTSSYDSALYDQGIWLLSEGRAPFVTLMGRNMFGDHSSFVLLLLVPAYWLFPGAGILFFSQSAVIALGSVPVFLYARTRLSGEWPALVLASCYLVHPAIGWTNLENFHPDSFLGVFVGGALWAALDRRWKTYAVFIVLALSVKEDASLVLVPLGIWVALRRDRRIGLATIFGSLAFMAFAMFVVMRGLIGVPTRNAWRIPFGGPTGVVDTAVTEPTALFRYLRSDDRPWYLVQMTAPFAWLFARLPWVAAISGLVLFTNILSTFWYQYQIRYHYSLVAVPALSIGTVHAIGALKRRREVRSLPFRLPIQTMAVGLVAIAALVTSFLWSPVPWGRTGQFYGNPDNPWAVQAREIMALVPDGASVSAHYRITPHLAYRDEIYQFPTPFRAVLYGPDGNVDGPRIPDRAEGVEYVLLPIPGAGPTQFPEVDWAVVQPAFELVAANDFWELHRRDPDVALPPER